MFRSRHNRLFRDYDLGSNLRQRLLDLETEIRSLSADTINESDQLIQTLLVKYNMEVPVLNEDKINIDAHEAMIEVIDDFGPRFGRDRSISVPGLAITVRIPFSGSGELLKCQASTWSPSGTPDASIEGQNLVLSYETRDKDPEKIKALWKGDIDTIKQNLGWIDKDLSNYNNSLESNLNTALAKRKKDANEAKSLIDKLKE